MKEINIKAYHSDSKNIISYHFQTDKHIFLINSTIKEHLILKNIILNFFESKDLPPGIEWLSMEFKDNSDNFWKIKKERDFAVYRNFNHLSGLNQKQQIFDMVFGERKHFKAYHINKLSHSMNLHQFLFETHVFNKYYEMQKKLLLANWSQALGRSAGYEQIREASSTLTSLYSQYKQLLLDYRTIRPQKLDEKINVSYLLSLTTQINIIKDLSNQYQNIYRLIQETESLPQQLKDLTENRSNLKNNQQTEVNPMNQDEWASIIKLYIERTCSRNYSTSLSDILTHLKETLTPKITHIKDSLSESKSQKQKLGTSWFEKFKKNQKLEIEDYQQVSMQLDLVESALTAYQKTFQEIQTSSHNNYKTIDLKWQRLCSFRKIATDTSLEQLLSQLSHQLKILILDQKIQEIQARLSQVEQEFTLLLSHLKRWQDETGSHKSFDIKDRNQILVETKNIIRYQEEKEKTCRYLQQNLIDIAKKQAIQNLFEQRAKFIQKKWNDCFSQKSWPVIAITDKNIEKLINQGMSVQHTLDLKEDLTSKLQSGDLGLTSSFMLWTMSQKTDESLLSFCKQLSLELKDSVHFVVSTDATPNPATGSITITTESSTPTQPTQNPKDIQRKKTYEILGILNGSYKPESP